MTNGRDVSSATFNRRPRPPASPTKKFSHSKSPKMSKYFALLLLCLSSLVGSLAAPREFSEDTEEEAVRASKIYILTGSSYN